MTIPENPRPSEDYPGGPDDQMNRTAGDQVSESWTVPTTSPRPPGTVYPDLGGAGSTGSVGTDQTATDEGRKVAHDAKEGGRQVAEDAKDSGKQVAQTAQEEARHVAETVSEQARSLYGQTTSELSSQASTQQQRLAEGLRSLADQFGTMADNSDDSGQATSLVREASARTQGVASWLEEREPGDLVQEVTSFARRKPGTFIAIAAGVGLVAGRLTKSLTSGTDETGESDLVGPGSGKHRPDVPSPAAAGSPVAATPGAVAPDDDLDLTAPPVYGTDPR